MLTVNEIIDFFKLQNSHAKKELGQNFLINNQVCDFIVSKLDIVEADKVLEIGPGLGALTDIIVNKSSNYTVVEYDQKFVDFLSREYEGKINIIKNNILKFRDFSFNKVIGNLPYYITTDIIEFIATKFEKLDKAVFMIQKECFRRITAKSGKDYNAINILLSYLYDVKEEGIVKKDNFFPAPKVDSLVFSLTRNQQKEWGFAGFLYKTAKICFSNRRKTIANNLVSMIKDRGVCEDILTSINLKITSRAEELTLSDFENLTKVLLNKGIYKL